jgi:hypothetical protein
VTGVYKYLWLLNVCDVREKATTHQHSPPHRLAMQLRNGVQTLDAYRPTFDPHLDIATVVFSHVQCVKTRHSLALVSKLWRDASKPAAAYPRRFDFDAFPDMILFAQLCHRIGLLDNDEALSLSYERVVGLLGQAAKTVCYEAARRGSVRLLKWTRENNNDWDASTCFLAAQYGHLSALKYLHENGCPWDRYTCSSAAAHKHWDCLQYAVDNKCPQWEEYAKKYAEHLR